MGGERRHQRAQILLSTEGTTQQGEEMLTGGEASLVSIGSVPTNMVVKTLPRETRDDLFEQGRLMAHDIGSAAVDNAGERRPRSKINVVHKYKHKSCRTAVRQAEAWRRVVARPPPPTPSREDFRTPELRLAPAYLSSQMSDRSWFT